MNVEVELLPAAAASDAGLVGDLTLRINRAYGDAESALWLPGKERIAAERVAGIVADGELAVARSNGRIVGSLLVRELDPETGYFGLLAVDPAEQRSGVGRALVDFAESVSRKRGAKAMELRLLVPRSGHDEGKEWLGSWYERLGYRVIEREDFGASHPESVPAMRTSLDVLTFRKEL